MRHICALLALSGLFGVASANPPPMVDGRCGEASYMTNERIDLGANVSLHHYIDEHYVWLCYDYLDGSYGTLDLELHTPKLDRAINLHVSAQLGEWWADEPDSAPQTGDSDQWWETTGWTSNVIWMNGMDDEADPPQINFKNAEAREVQISKARFGAGQWTLRFNIRALSLPDGGRTNVLYPAEGEPAMVLQTD